MSIEEPRSDASAESVAPGEVRESARPTYPPSRPLSLLMTTTMAPLPPAPPHVLSPGTLVATQPQRGRQLQSTVDSFDGLKQSLDDGVGHVVLQEGVYDLTSGMTQMCVKGMLCLVYAVTIEAEVAGTVVLNASRSNRVFYITGTGVELVGLNITGGYTSGHVSGRCRTPALFKLWNLLLFHSARLVEPYPSPR